jgi:hypothetical protein
MSKLPKVVAETLRFTLQNQQLSGFSGTITPETEEHVMRLCREGKLKRRKPAYRPKPGR